MAHGKNTRIVDEPQFHQNVEGPERLAHDGIARRAISEHCGPGNVFDQLRIALGHPAQHEESSSDIKLLEDGEQSLSVSNHARFTRGPTITMYVWRQRRNVKVVLHINGQRVAYARGRVVHGSPKSAFLG